MNSDFNWKCPFCFHSQVVTSGNAQSVFVPLHLGQSVYGDIALDALAISCLNRECREVFLQVNFTEKEAVGGRWVAGRVIQKYILRPDHSARVFPEFIPQILRQDYVEACRIKLLSPKASATVARRCIQGAIRDFCGISKHTLDAEIKYLIEMLSSGSAPAGVTTESVEAIDHLRKIGNIGAHMERDINLIIDIDEGEAQSLIDLIELLFDEWYVEREARGQRLARLKQIRIEKDLQRGN